jgi:HAD superfamily hydrolase (TIGR01509 family)
MPLLFDLDGTLIDSEVAHKEAEVETFAEFGLHFTVDDLFRFTGVPYGSMISQVAPEVGVERFLEVHRERLIACIGSRIKPFDDATSCLQRFSSTPIGLATSSPRWYVQAVMDTFPELCRFARNHICGDDVKNGKPSPEPFQRCAASLGFSADECVAVEDSANGVLSAKSAGCYTIAVRRDSRIDLSKADEIVEDLNELTMTLMDSRTISSQPREHRQ